MQLAPTKVPAFFGTAHKQTTNTQWFYTGSNIGSLGFTNFTICGWTWFTHDPNLNTMYYLDLYNFTDYQCAATNNTNKLKLILTLGGVYNEYVPADSIQPKPNQWLFMGIIAPTSIGGAFTLYWSAAKEDRWYSISGTQSFTSIRPDQIYVTSGHQAGIMVGHAHTRLFNTSLTPIQLRHEKWNFQPRGTEYAYYPLGSYGVKDATRNARNLTFTNTNNFFMPGPSLLSPQRNFAKLYAPQYTYSYPNTDVYNDGWERVG